VARLNRVIEKLIQGEIVFSSGPVPNASFDAAQTYGDSDLDMVIFEMEHHGFDLEGLRTSLHAMLSRRRIHDDGLAPSVVPMTRIPPNARETSQWIVKQVLDAGVYGFVAPQVQTPEDATAVVKASRYPARRGSSLGGGERGYWPTAPARYWGIPEDEYVDRADLWPVNPEGELLVVAIVESARGVANLERILDATDGIGAIWVGTGDLAADMGLIGELAHPEVEENVQRVVEVCCSRNVPCAIGVAGVEDAVRRVQQGFRIIVTRPGIAGAVRAASELNAAG
jgi:4-hydroxy-2-oxoheptanedioate aldolase